MRILDTRDAACRTGSRGTGTGVRISYGARRPVGTLVAAGARAVHGMRCRARFAWVLFALCALARPVAADTVVARVNVGGPRLVDSLGRVWEANLHGPGGDTRRTHHSIVGTDDQRLYQSARRVTGRDPLPVFVRSVPAGEVRVRLHFAAWEKRCAPGDEVFDVVIGDQAVATALDLCTVAGPRTAHVLETTITVEAGDLAVCLVALRGRPQLCAVEVVRLDDAETVASPPPLALHRIDCGGAGGWAADGAWWSADAALPGTTVRRTKLAVAGAGGAVPCQTARESRAGKPLQYALRVPAGELSVRLHFAELVTSTKAGKRICDVRLEGQLAARGLDIVQRTGAPLRGCVEEYIVSVRDGVLDLEIVPVGRSAVSLNGIEVMALALDHPGQAPEFVATPPLAALAGRPYLYRAQVRDPDGDRVQIALVSAPPGVELQPGHGLVTWIPSAQQIGQHELVLRAVDGTGHAVDQRFTVTVHAAETATAVHRIQCGGRAFTDASGRAWAADHSALDGRAYTSRQKVAGTLHPALYQAQRCGTDRGQLRYRLAVPNGLHEVVLHFAELDLPKKTKVRLLDVRIEERLVLTGFELAKLGKATAGSRSFLVPVEDGELAIDLRAVVGAPALAAIEVILRASPPPALPPVIVSLPASEGTVGHPYTYAVEATGARPLHHHLLAGPPGCSIDAASGALSWHPSSDQIGLHDLSVQVADARGLSAVQHFAVEVSYRLDAGRTVPRIDSEGRSWIPDEAFVRSPSLARSVTRPIHGTADPGLYQTQRLAVGERLEYSLALPPGRYHVAILSAETLGAAAGTRRASVQIEGVEALAELDLVVARGGPDIAGAEIFDAVVVMDGELHIELVGRGESAPLIGAIEVRRSSRTNEAPAIVSDPLDVVVAGTPYRYDVAAVDADLADPLTLTLIEGPPGMVVGAGDAPHAVTWWPGESDLGSWTVTVEVRDSDNRTAHQSFLIEVLESDNQPPVLLSLPPTHATVAVPWIYDVVAVDPNPGSTAHHELLVAPPGAVIDPQSGRISWTPSGLEFGSQDFTVRVTDDGLPARSAQQSFAVQVAYRIDCGEFVQSRVDSLGFAWSLDLGFDNPPSERYTIPNAIAGTVDDWLFQSERYSFAPQFSYRLPLPATPMQVELTLLFSESYFTGTGQRLFHVEVQGDRVLQNLDLVGASGGRFRAISRTYDVLITGGELVITLLNAGASAAKIDGIRVQASTAANLPPRIASTPPPVALSQQEYRYAVEVVDPNLGDRHTHALFLAPAGAGIDGTTGVLTWTPSAAQIGLHEFTVRASDALGLFTEQSFTVEVLPPGNLAPMFINQPPTSATVWAPLVASLVAVDQNPEDVLSYEILVGPDGVSLDPVSGVLTWMPTHTQLGFHDFLVAVSDGHAPPTELAFEVRVMIRIDCGSTVATVDSAGDTWIADFGYQNAPGEVYAVMNPILDTTDDGIFQDQRYTLGPELRYELPVPTGDYLVKLLFSELYFTADGRRIFDVVIEDELVLHDYDIRASARGSFRAHHEEFAFAVTDGLLVISLMRGLHDYPTISGIEVEPLR